MSKNARVPVIAGAPNKKARFRGQLLEVFRSRFARLPASQQPAGLTLASEKFSVLKIFGAGEGARLPVLALFALALQPGLAAHPLGAGARSAPAFSPLPEVRNAPLAHSGVCGRSK